MSTIARLSPTPPRAYSLLKFLFGYGFVPFNSASRNFKIFASRFLSCSITPYVRNLPLRAFSSASCKFSREQIFSYKLPIRFIRNRFADFLGKVLPIPLKLMLFFAKWQGFYPVKICIAGSRHTHSYSWLCNSYSRTISRHSRCYSHYRRTRRPKGKPPVFLF